MEKHYQTPKTDVVLFSTTDIMQLGVASGSEGLGGNPVGNAPKKRDGVF